MENMHPSASMAKSPVVLSTSASASFHSHLSVSSSSSQRRLRAPVKLDSDELPQPDRPKSPAVLRSVPPSPQTSDLPLYYSHKAASQLKPLSIAQWLLAAYCLLSAVFLTARLLAVPKVLYIQGSSEPTDSISPINDMPLPYRLSRLLQNGPQPVSFSPFVSKAQSSYDYSAITACAWIDENDIKELAPWSSAWDGPMSIVVVSRGEPRQVRSLMKQIDKLPTVRNKAHFHIVREVPNGTRAVNTYLNLARLFAPTRHVVLFPESPLVPVPEKLFRRLSMYSATLNETRLASPLVLSSSRSRSNSPIPFLPLSPLLVEKSYPIWCSERFFTSPSREEEWEECLWQFWINSYGQLSSLVGAGRKLPSSKNKAEVVKSSTYKGVIHRRLSNRFRHESCILAAKQLKDRSKTPGKVDTRKAQWLRKTCRQAMVGWGKELL